MKKPIDYLFIIVLLVITAGSYGQPVHDWTFTTGGDVGIYNEGGMEIFVDDEGYIYTQGYFAGTADFERGIDSVMVSSQSDEYRSCYIAKYDSLGHNIWAFPFDFADGQSSGYLDINISMTVSSNGEIYILAANKNPLADIDPGQGEVFPVADYKHILVKYNSDGEYLWYKGFDFEAHSTIALDQDDNLVIAGHFWGEIDFDASENEVLLGTDIEGQGFYFVAKYDLNGNYIWAMANKVEAAFPQTFYSLRYRKVNLDMDGNIYILGDIAGMVDLDPGIDTFIIAAPFGSQCYLVKYSPQGDLIWAHTWEPVIDGPANACNSMEFKIDNEDNLIVIGHYHGATDFDFSENTFILDTDATTDDWYNYIAKYSKDAELMWAFSLNSFSAMHIFGANTDKQNNIYITGELRYGVDLDPGPGSQIVDMVGGTDIFIAKYSPEADYVWSFNMGGPSGGPAQERGMDLVIDSKDNIYATGKFYKTCDFDPSSCVYDRTTEPNDETADIYIAKYTQDCTPSNYPILDVKNDFLCVGESTVINVLNFEELYNGNYWFLYEDSCSGIPVDSSEFGSFTVFPLESVTFYIVGQGCCFDELNCDSVSIDVAVEVVPTFADTTICKGDSVMIFGSFESTAQIYVDTLTNKDGCDSTHSIELFVTIVSNEMNVFGDSLVALQANAMYQWYDCNSGFPISGATHQSYTPTISGNYSVEVTYDGCLVVSDCVEYLIVFQKSTQEFSKIKVYPNPVVDVVKIQTELSSIQADIQLFDTKGNLVFRDVLNTNMMTIDMSDYVDGIYFLRAQTETTSVVVKLVKI